MTRVNRRKAPGKGARDKGPWKPRGEPKQRPKAPEWRENLINGREGPLSIVANITTVLQHHPDWVEVLAYDELTEQPVATRPPPWSEEDAPAGTKAGPWTDDDTGRLIVYLARVAYLHHVRASDAEQAIAVVAATRRFHPVRKYLLECQKKWIRDGRRKRLDRIVPDYFGGEDSPYTRGVGPKWMIGAAARVMKPGCKVNYAFILESDGQDRDKSSAVKALVPDPSWCSDTPIDIGSKDSYEALRGIWIHCFDELDSIHRSAHTRTKTFLTATSDRFRPAYARRARVYPRQAVFFGTTDRTEYLTDPSGNRRYWPVHTRGTNVKALIRDRDLLWGEAVHRYKKGEPWWPDTALKKLCMAEQAARVIPDDWLGPVEAWCRANDTGEGVLTLDVLMHALDFATRDKIGNQHTMRAAES